VARARTFDGIDDWLSLEGGAVDLTATGFTIITVGRAFARVGWQSILQSKDTGGSEMWSHEFSGGDNLMIQASGTDAYSTWQMDPDVWQIWALTKPVGSSAVRFHKYDFDTSTWTRDNGAAVLNPTGVITQLFPATWAGAEYFGGEFAAQAIFGDDLSDAEMNAIPAMTRDEFLAMANMLWCVFYDQASVTDPILDLIGNLDESNRIGTTVFVGDVPWPLEAMAEKQSFYYTRRRTVRR
jgi:DNA-binding beta-propeller fold protein YncE